MQKVRVTLQKEQQDLVFWDTFSCSKKSQLSVKSSSFYDKKVERFQIESFEGSEITGSWTRALASFICTLKGRESINFPVYR